MKSSGGVDFAGEFKKARDGTKGKGVASIFTRYGLCMVYIMLLVIFPLLWAVILLAGTVGVAYAKWGKKKFGQKLALIPLWALGFLAGILIGKKKTTQPASTTETYSGPDY